MRAALLGGLVLAGGAAVGFAVRLAADGPSPGERAAAAMTAALAVATVAAGCADLRGRGAGARLGAAGACAALTWSAAAAAGAAAGGGADVLGGALVAAAVAVLGLGVAAVLRACGAGDGTAVFAAVGIASAPAALLFVADPWVEARGATAESPARAQTVYTASPLAAMTSGDGGVGVDWQRMPWMYDGPAPGTPGLSVVGQFHPATPPSPFVWSAVVLGAGAALVAAARARR